MSSRSHLRQYHGHPCADRSIALVSCLLVESPRLRKPRVQKPRPPSEVRCASPPAVGEEPQSSHRRRFGTTQKTTSPSCLVHGADKGSMTGRGRGDTWRWSQFCRLTLAKRTNAPRWRRLAFFLSGVVRAITRPGASRGWWGNCPAPPCGLPRASVIADLLLSLRRPPMMAPIAR